MFQKESLGIKRLESLHYYVHNLERSHRYYTQQLDFACVAKSGQDLEERGHQRSEVYAAGNCMVMCSAPKGEGGRAWRFLQKHPDGVGSLIFEVEDIQRAWDFLEKRGGTFINDIQHETDDHGKMSHFSITTPFGDCTFRFVQRQDYSALYPGMTHVSNDLSRSNRFDFVDFDHITSNFQTMKPALLWMEHVMGLETFWKIEFHTDDVNKNGKRGSGLRSMVMYDPNSNVKFANNEPLRPFFKQSQINIFNEEHRGDGVQHVAVTVKDIIACVSGMRAMKTEFMPTPHTYYEALPKRLQDMKVGAIDEDINVLRDLQILVDGEEKHQYLLQIFLKESAGTHKDIKAGPFFYELIQRKGDKGFGGGNFRALFDSIERVQRGENVA